MPVQILYCTFAVTVKSVPCNVLGERKNARKKEREDRPYF